MEDLSLVAELLTPRGGEACWSGERRDDPDRKPVDSYCVLPSAANPRWILPVSDPRAFRGALQLCRPGRRAGRWLKTALGTASALGLGGKLPGDRMQIFGPAEPGRSPHLLETVACRHISGAVRRFALTVGTPGPFRKIAFLGLGESGRPRMFGKCGRTKAAAERVRREAAVVRSMHALGLRSLAVPEPLWSGAERNWEFSLQRAVREQPDAKDSPPVEAFSEELARKTARRAPLSSGEFWQRLESKPTPLRPERLERVRSAFDGTELPLGWMHGDLASWNLLRSQDGWYAADWELATEGAPPLMDFFHFRIFEPLLLRELTPAAAADGLLDGPAALAASRILRALQAEHLRLKDLLALYLWDRVARLHEEQLGQESSDRAEQIGRLCAVLERVQPIG